MKFQAKRNKKKRKKKRTHCVLENLFGLLLGELAEGQLGELVLEHHLDQTLNDRADHVEREHALGGRRGHHGRMSARCRGRRRCGCHCCGGRREAACLLLKQLVQLGQFRYLHININVVEIFSQIFNVSLFVVVVLVGHSRRCRA